MKFKDDLAIQTATETRDAEGLAKLAWNTVKTIKATVLPDPKGDAEAKARGLSDSDEARKVGYALFDSAAGAGCRAIYKNRAYEIVSSNQYGAYMIMSLKPVQGV